eukprot:234634_1
MSTVDADPWCMRTYTWMEWAIFVMIELILSLICVCCGVCGYHNLIKHHVYWASDIEDVDEDKRLALTTTMSHMSMTFSRMFPSKPSHISKTVLSRNDSNSKEEIPHHTEMRYPLSETFVRRIPSAVNEDEETDESDQQISANVVNGLHEEDSSEEAPVPEQLVK